MVIPQIEILSYLVSVLKGKREEITNQENTNETSYRILFTCINMIRILQKLTKDKPQNIQILIKQKAAVILKKTLKLEHRIFKLYCLKVLKSCIKYLQPKWIRQNMHIISLIYLNVKPELKDDWLTASELDNCSQYDTMLRNAIEKFNKENYKEWWKHVDDNQLVYPEEEGFLPIDSLSYIYNQIQLDESFYANYESWIQNQIL